MFDDKFFEQWLDGQAQQIMEQVASGQSISPEQMMVLVLKAQINHFSYLDTALREDIHAMDKRLSGEMQSMNERLGREMQDLRRGFEQVEKHFELVDKRFEHVDKRFEMLISRIEYFMMWSFVTTFMVGGLVVVAIKFLP